MDYPALADVISADRGQIACWSNFLQEPETPAEERVMDLIFKKFCVNGGFIAPELRKKVGRTASG
jgi:hypothetical protein